MCLPDPAPPLGHAPHGLAPPSGLAPACHSPAPHLGPAPPLFSFQPQPSAMTPEFWILQPCHPPCGRASHTLCCTSHHGHSTGPWPSHPNPARRSLPHPSPAPSCLPHPGHSPFPKPRLPHLFLSPMFYNPAPPLKPWSTLQIPAVPCLPVLPPPSSLSTRSFL